MTQQDQTVINIIKSCDDIPYLLKYVNEPSLSEVKTIALKRLNVIVKHQMQLLFNDPMTGLDNISTSERLKDNAKAYLKRVHDYVLAEQKLINTTILYAQLLETQPAHLTDVLTEYLITDKQVTDIDNSLDPVLLTNYVNDVIPKLDEIDCAYWSINA